MPRNPTTGVFTRVDNSFSEPVQGTVIDPVDAIELFDDYDGGLTFNDAEPLQLIGSTSGTVTILAPDTASGTITLPAGTTNFSATGGAGQVVKQASSGGAFTVGTVPASEIASPEALTKADDTNVTLTLGGTPATALLKAVSLTLGWTGLLGLVRGGTAADLSSTGGAGQVLKQSTVGGVVTVSTLPATDIASPAALTKTDDTNVTLTLGGTPATALLRAASLTLGWTGLLSVARGGTGLGSGTSGGILGFTATGTLASSAALATNGVVVGGGAGATPTAVTAGTNGQILLGVTSSAPAMGTMSGDATITNAGALTIANSAVTNAKMANAAAYTFKGNATGSSAAPQDFTIGGLTHKSSPAITDLLVISDQAASGATKYSTIAEVIGSIGTGVTSIGGATGAITLGSGLSITGTALSTSTGVLTNVLLTKTADYTLAAGDSGKTIQLGTGTTGLFTLTIPSVSGFASDFSCNVVNGDSGRGKKIAGAGKPANLSSILWPLQSFQLRIVNGAFVATNTGRWKSLNGTTITIYADVTNGDDSNDGLASGAGNAVKTITQAYVNIVQNQWDLWAQAAPQVILQCADGTYPEQIHIPGILVGGNGNATIKIVGNAGTPANVILSGDGTATPILATFDGAILEIESLKLQGTSSTSCISALTNSIVRVNTGVIFGALGSTGAHMSAVQGAQIIIDASYTISGDATGGNGYHWYCTDGGAISAQGVTATLSSNIGVNTFAFAQRGARINAINVTYTLGGHTVSGRRYYTDDNAVISTSTAGINAIPGSTAGVGTNPGTTPFGLYN